MFNRINTLLKGEKGTVLVLVAAAMVAIAGFTAIVTDAGLLYLNRIKLVNALDSAVLAGAQELPTNPDGALQTASDYAQRNGVNLNDCSFHVADDHRSISASANRNVGLIFARVLGINSGKVKGSAGARIAPVTGVKGVVPFGVISDNFTFGQEVILKQGGGDGYRGWFQALSLGGTGASNYTNNISNGYQKVVKIGNIIPTETGDMSGPTKQGVQDRISACNEVPPCSPTCFDKDCPRIVIVPMIVTQDSLTVKVVGFGAFLLSDYIGNGNDNELEGAFIQYVSPQETDSDGPDYGLYKAELYE